MKQSWRALLIAGTLLAGAGPAVAAGSGAASGSAEPVHRDSQGPPEQREMPKTTGPSRDERILRDTRTAPVQTDSLPEMDHERLRDLEQELAEEQLKEPVRDRDRLQGKQAGD